MSLSSVRIETFPPHSTSHRFSRQATVAPMAMVSTIRNENEFFFAVFVDFPFFFVYDYFVHCVYSFEMFFYFFLSFLFVFHLVNDGLEVLSLRFGECGTLLHSL